MVTERILNVKPKPLDSANRIKYHVPFLC